MPHEALSAGSPHPHLEPCPLCHGHECLLVWDDCPQLLCLLPDVGQQQQLVCVGAAVGVLREPKGAHNSLAAPPAPMLCTELHQLCMCFGPGHPVKQQQSCHNAGFAHLREAALDDI